MIPLFTDRPLRRTPLVNYSLLAANVAVAMVVSGSASAGEWTRQHLVLDPARAEIWQFVTYQFLHDRASVMHLLGNMLFLWVFGNAVEDRLGRWAYLCFYLAGGVVAGLVHCMVEPGHPIIGASGSVSAVTGIFLALFPWTRIRILWLFFLITMIEVPSLWFIGFSFARDTYYFIRGGGGVAYSAHLAGNLFGFVVGMGLLLTRLLPREPYDLMTMLSQWNRRRQFAALADRGFDPWSGRAPGRKDAFAGSAGSPKNLPAVGVVTGGAAAESMDPIATMRAEIANLHAHGALPEAAKAYRELLDRQPGVALGSAVQLDLANQFFKEGDYERAAQGYVLMLKNHPTADPGGRVHLLLGLTLARYQDLPKEAKPVLEVAAQRLGPGEDRELARELLAEVTGKAGGGGTGGKALR